VLKKILGGARSRLAPAFFVRAALVGKEAEEIAHNRIIGPAHEGGGLPLLRHEAGHDEPVEVVRERRCRDREALLDLPDRQAHSSCANQCSVEVEAGRIPERFELLGGLFEFHGNKMRVPAEGVKRYFQEDRINALMGPEHNQ
jgi:hypothetical protein